MASFTRKIEFVKNKIRGLILCRRMVTLECRMRISLSHFPSILQVSGTVCTWAMLCVLPFGSLQGEMVCLSEYCPGGLQL